MFGIFQDAVETGPLVMVLSDCGRNLWVHRSNESYSSIIMPESERYVHSQLFCRTL